MNILMTTSETVPFSKSGGLADVVGALSSALADRGHTVRVLMPAYGFIETSKFKKHCDLCVQTAARREKAELLETDVGKVKYLALSHPLFTGRKGIYGDTSFEPYGDNCYRYLLFSLFTDEYAKQFDPDIIHAHDWTVGMVPVLAKRRRSRGKTVYTIHNLAYQGDFSRYDLLTSGIRPSESMLTGRGTEKRFNMLKTGLEYSDCITTVSETYAKEIQGAEQGCGLESVLQSRKDVLYGIINGIDTNEWTPEGDQYFETHYSASDLSGKAKLKAEVQKEFGLEVNANVPLIAMISRLASQKGFSELLDGHVSALERILREGNSQVLIIGTGDEHYVSKLRELGAKYDNISVNIIFSLASSHRVEGAADLFLMPSCYEPCGLNQLYSLHYGTPVIAHRTGGLADSIVDIDSFPNEGTGFLFDQLNGDTIVDNVKRAVSYYYDNRPLFEKMRIRGMNADFTWEKSAEKYEKVYTQLISGGARNDQ